MEPQKEEKTREYRTLQNVREGKWNTHIIYGFFIDKVDEYFEVPDGGDWCEELENFRESIEVQKKWEIKLYTTDFEYSVANSEGSDDPGHVAIVGIVIESLTVHYNGAMRIPNINEHEYTRKILDKFADKNPCFKNQTPSLHVYTTLNK